MKARAILQCACVGVVACAGAVQGATIRFDNGNSTNVWEDATNWVGDVLPSNIDVAELNANNNPNVNWNLTVSISSAQTVDEVTVHNPNGSGTFIADGPPTLETEPLHFLAALHGFTRDEMFEARRMIEVGVAALSATRATGEQIAAIAEEVTSMFASLDNPHDFLRHDIRFHQAVAAACGNPILTSLVEMLSQVFYERRRETVGRARDFRESAEMHRRIYMAIRQRDSAAAREAMDRHLQLSYEAQANEDGEGQADEVSA